MKIAILGFGTEGRSVLKYLKKSPQFKNADIYILDRNINIKKPILSSSQLSSSQDDNKTITQLSSSQDDNIKFQNNERGYLKGLDRFDIVFRSPGVPYNLPEIQAYEKRVSVRQMANFDNVNAPMRILSSGTQLFFEQLRGLKQKNIKVIGITGTKGKSTTSTLLYKILKAAGYSVYLAGNIGVPALDVLPRLSASKNTGNPRQSASIFIILELSSFQLQGLNLRAGEPDIAIILDVFPDHLDSHRNFREYINAKASIARWQTEKNRVFYFADQEGQKSKKVLPRMEVPENGGYSRWSKWIAQKSKAKKIPVRNYEIRNQYENTKLRNDLARVLKLPGEHNLKNVLMAATVAKELGVPAKIILNTIKNFRGLEHRLEFIRSIRVNPRSNPRLSVSIRFYNDSASTNPHTAAAAIRAFPDQPLILIAGGRDKNLNYSPFAKALKNSNTKLVVLFGENKNKIQKAISNREIVIRKVKNLDRAVQLAYRTAKSLVASGYPLVAVIFSPASASQDMFRDYKERGEKFKEIVKSFKV